MSFLLAHLSDLHLGPLARPRARDLAGKRLTGWINWERSRAHVHNMDVLDALIADIHAQKPDHVAVTGDLANIGLPDEFALARTVMEKIGSPENVSFTPGNHDAYTPSSLPHLARAFTPWTTSDAPTRAPYPYMRVRENVALIGLSSGVPTAPFMASGRLGPAQRDALGRLLDEAGARKLIRVVMLHHPPHRLGASMGRGLTDARAFETLIARHGAELIVHGHNHRLAVAHLRSADRKPTPVVGVASASAAGGSRTHRAGYNLFRIERTNEGVSIAATTRGLMDDRRTIGDLGPIAL
ncbi:MAG: metallophosphoesterase [Hyphomicrobiales bacterium]|nr:metallophosphoesterase [Hyphomicrobiales bacterium]